MGAGAFIEPLVVVTLLFGGAWVNRERKTQGESVLPRPGSWHPKRNDSPSSVDSGRRLSDAEDGPPSGASSPRYLATADDGWRTRKLQFLGKSTEVRSPDTSQFADRLLSRVLRRFPFLVEVWYWALIYWVYQLGRAFTAVTLVEGTVHTARRHAIQLVHLEQSLRLFWEPEIQKFFLQHPTLMHWINRTYSFIHIPGTILFLIWLYYLTITANRTNQRPVSDGSPGGPALYQARRRTMATCNLIAFIVFTLWPCMPPRLLSDPEYDGPQAKEAKSFGFVDTVHGAEGESSVWTQNKFCNQYAAMPSLHFGYSLLIGLSIAMIPLSSETSRSVGVMRLRIRVPSGWRLVCLFFGIAYPSIILLAIISTANHFILDAVAGAMVCGIAWHANGILLNLLPLEDWFLWCVRMHKPNVEARVAEGWEEKSLLGGSASTTAPL